MCIALSMSAQELPKVLSGSIQRLTDFNSKFVTSRNIDIWLPEGYTESKKYSVLYMHDGQMLFDAKTTWNKQAWNADQTITRLMKSGQLSPTIIVGIWNNGQFRHSEYFPEKFLPHMPEAPRQMLIQKGLRDKPQSDAYLRFLVEELKPYIDTKIGRAHV